MKKIIFALVGVVATWNMAAQAPEFNQVAGSVTWQVGNETDAAIAPEISAAVKGTTMKAGTDLTVTTINSLACNSGVTMTLFAPATSKPGNNPADMVEYTIQMKKGLTFTLTGISYDAVKKGTDDCFYSWSYEIDGKGSDTTAMDKSLILRDNNTTGSPALRHEELISGAAAGQTVKVRFFMSGVANNKQVALGKVVVNGTVTGTEIPRLFKNFKVDFRTDPYMVVEPAGSLPEGVIITGSFKDNQHGLTNSGATIKVPVDGPVKFTIGNCQYSGQMTVKNRHGNVLVTMSPNGACENSVSDIGSATYNSFITWNYNVEAADTLLFDFNGCYLPYFMAEACDFIPQVEVSYYDVDGKTCLATEVIEGGSALTYNAEATTKVTVADGMAFRGWFAGTAASALKMAEGTPLTEDTKLFAKTTPIELALTGTHYLYDLKQAYFYPEDHELLMTDGVYHDAKHGFLFNKGQYMKIAVSPKCYVNLGMCMYSATADQKITNAAGDSIAVMSVVKEETTDGALCSFYYANPSEQQDTVVIPFTATTYLHVVEIFNVEAPLEKEGQRYTLASGDGAMLLMVLGQLQSGDTIYLPNGTYDLGESVLNTVSASNVVVMGESMEGVIIRNAPGIDVEGISTTATILNTGNGNKYENLTLQNAMDYYASLAKTSNGRAVCFQDKGNKTVCYRVRMLSYQDTYYGNKQGTQRYFEDCELHGTVDFICGDGSVYFYNCLLYCEKRNLNGSGEDCLTASNADASDKGYVFDRCTVKSESPTVSLGRAWNNKPRCVYLLTTFDYSAGNFSVTKSGSITRWTLAGMNSLPDYFAEYNTMNTAGEIISPAENTVTFSYNGTKQMNTIIGYEEAVQYTYPTFFTDWNPAVNYVSFPMPTDIRETYLFGGSNAAHKYLRNGRLLLVRNGIVRDGLGRVIQ